MQIHVPEGTAACLHACMQACSLGPSVKKSGLMSEILGLNRSMIEHGPEHKMCRLLGSGIRDGWPVSFLQVFSFLLISLFKDVRFASSRFANIFENNNTTGLRPQHFQNWPRAGSLDNVTIKFFAYYFPQFYNAPENGGENDWLYFRNPNFTMNGNRDRIIRPLNHVYYDPRLLETRLTQRILANKYGIDGFIYYDYWFTYPLLPDVVEMLLEDGEPAVEFAFMWVNEPFNIHSVLYTDPLRHALHVARFFRHHLYLHLKGRPVYYIYHAIKVPTDYLYQFSNCLTDMGFPKPYIIQAIQDYGGNTRFLDYVDGYAEFNVNLRHADQNHNWPNATQLGIKLNYDNTPRATKGKVHHGELPLLRPTKNRTVEKGRHDKALIRQLCINKISWWYKRMSGEKIVTFFAWNEWSEQAALEPSDVYGYTMLEAVAECKSEIVKILTV